jgi:dTDP-4-amino-4,6-dideoxygalactose transaminase
VKPIPFGRPWITDEDRQAVQKVLEGPILTHGPEGEKFEAEFSAFLGGEAHAVAVSSCMAALHLACLELGLTVGDEVIVPSQTHAATAHAVELVGARPVFVDADPATGNVTARGVEAALTSRTRAVIVVHFVGIPCAMPEILAVTDRHGLRLIEDCALAPGARIAGRSVGLFGDAGCFSFYPVKHITTGEGGMFVSRHADLARSVSRKRAFGVQRASGPGSSPGLYDVPQVGLNYRMSEIQAALGRSQLGRLRENLARRGSNVLLLRKSLEAEGLRVLQSTDPRVESSFYCLSFVLEGPQGERRAELLTRLAEKGIGTSVYYPHPVPRLRYYREKYGYAPERFPGAAGISDRSISLPVGPHLGSEEAQHVAGTVVDTLKEMGR